MKPLHIDGTTLEGGGQLVRLSVGLAALTGRHIIISDIRGGRGGGGGLKRQHLVAVEWLAEACNASTDGAELGSRRLEFEPGTSTNQKRKFKETTTSLHDGTIARNIVIDLCSPGAVTLVLQAVLPFILLSTPSPRDHLPKPVVLTLHGGTNCSASPSLDYIQQVTIHNLIRAGLPAQFITSYGQTRRGYTQGSSSIGQTSFLVHPLRAGNTLPSLDFSSAQGSLVKINITLLAPGGFALTHLSEVITETLKQKYPNVLLAILVQEDSRHWRRYYTLIVAETSSGFRLGVDRLHEGKVPKGDDGSREVINSMVTRSVSDLEDELSHHEPLDHWMQDQIVVFQGLAAGKSLGGGAAREQGTSREATLHTRTAKWAVAKLLPGAFFDAVGDDCDGVGLTAGQIRRMTTRRHDEDVATELAQLSLEDQT
ncbi:MAG: hypothetical protein M1828_000263 [Chrysothrix sp. TS-e1954]|nr:MAG: hypothetical protein M1828_000263 [Chrysothrix sp. TS-e1954]